MVPSFLSSQCGAVRYVGWIVRGIEIQSYGQAGVVPNFSDHRDSRYLHWHFVIRIEIGVNERPETITVVRLIRVA